MAIYSGRLAAIASGNSTVPQVGNFTITSKADVKEFYDSATRGGAGRVAGNTDWSGSYTAHGVTPVPFPGAAFAIIGSIEGTKGITGTAVVDSFELTIDLKSAEPISHTITFSGNGNLTLGNAVAVDSTVAIKYPSKGCSFSMADVGGNFTALDDVTSMKLQIQAKNEPYVSSSTSGGTRRVAGNIDWNATIEALVSDVTTIVTPNTVKGLRLILADATYWELLWGISGEASNIVVDRAAVKPVSYSLAWHMSGFEPIGGNATCGSIKDPDGTTRWPTA